MAVTKGASLDDASSQRFGIALTIVGAVLHLQVVQYATPGWATFGFAVMVVGLLVTASPLGPPSATEVSSGDDRP